MVRAGAAPSSAGYGGDLQIQAAEWIEGVTGQPLEGEDFAGSLRDGVKLCDLINTIKPGAVKRVNRKEGQNKFKQMENISSFIRACRELGVKEYSLFETVDLYEGKDVGLVVKCLHALGGTAQLECPDFQGPHLGLKPVSRASPRKKAPAWSTPSSSSSSPSAPAPAKKTWSTPSSGQPSAPVAAASSSSPPSSLPQEEPRSRTAAAAAAGYPAPPPAATELPPPPFDHAASASNGAIDEPASSPPPPFDDTAPRWGSNEIHPSAVAAAAATVGSSPAGGGGGGATTPPPPYRDDLSSKFANSARVADRSNGSISPGIAGGNQGSPQATRPPSPPYKPPQSSYGFSQQHQPPPTQARGRSRSPPSRSQGGISAAAEAAPPAAAAAAAAEPPVTIKAASATSATSSPHRSPVGGRGGGYGLDAELAAKREANYDYDAEREAQEWIEDVTGEAFADEFGEELKDGQRLCNLINIIKPGAVRRVNASKMPFKQMENVSNFLKACRAVGVAEHSLFETVDLYEGKDIGLVVRCLHALGQTVQNSCPEYGGPRLGIRQTEANKREWTAEQQQQQLLNSSGAMSQLMAGSSKTMERGAVIKTGVTFGATQSGTGDPSAASGWTMGSAGTMDRAHIAKSGPTYGADYAGASGDTSGASSRFTAGHRR